MGTGTIVFIVCYCLLLCLYFYTETSGKLKYRAPNKAALSLMFFVFAAIEFNKNPLYGFNSISVIFMLALFLAVMGDLFLLIDLNRGGDFFLCGNIAFFIFYLCNFETNGIHIDQYFPILIIVPILICIWIILAQKCKKVFKFGKMKWPMILYLSSITLHGITGLFTAILVPNGLLMGLGSLLFMFSDYELVVDKFVKPKTKWLLRLNSLLYFVGMLLMVLGFAGY